MSGPRAQQERVRRLEEMVEQRHAEQAMRLRDVPGQYEEHRTFLRERLEQVTDTRERGEIERELRMLEHRAEAEIAHQEATAERLAALELRLQDEQLRLEELLAGLEDLIEEVLAADAG